MAWNLGLVRGTSRGLAREADRKYSDHIRQMNTDTSQLDAVINQMRYNKADRYRRERDTIADTRYTEERAENKRRWDITNTRAAAAEGRAKEAHTWSKDQHEYNKAIRPILEQRDADEHRWRSEQNQWLQEEREYQQAQRPIVEKRASDTHEWNRHRARYAEQEHKFLYGEGETPGYREVQRDTSQIELQRRLREEMFLQSPEGQAYQQRMRELGQEQIETGNEVNRARAWALRNPQSSGTSTARPKTLTYTDVKGIGAKLPSTRTMLKDHGTDWNPLNWGHRYLPWTAPVGEKSLTSQLQSSGVEAGLRLRRQTPGGIPIHEVEQHIGALWEGMLEQEIDGRILPDALFSDVEENQQSSRMNDAYRVFRAGVREGLGLPIEDSGDASGGLFDEFIESEAEGGEKIGEVDTSFWGTIAPPVVPSAAMRRWQLKE